MVTEEDASGLSTHSSGGNDSLSGFDIDTTDIDLGLVPVRQVFFGAPGGVPLPSPSSIPSLAKALSMASRTDAEAVAAAISLSSLLVTSSDAPGLAADFFRAGVAEAATRLFARGALAPAPTDPEAARSLAVAMAIPMYIPMLMASITRSLTLQGRVKGAFEAAAPALDWALARASLLSVLSFADTDPVSIVRAFTMVGIHASGGRALAVMGDPALMAGLARALQTPQSDPAAVLTVRGLGAQLLSAVVAISTTHSPCNAAASVGEHGVVGAFSSLLVSPQEPATRCSCCVHALASIQLLSGAAPDLSAAAVGVFFDPLARQGALSAVRAGHVWFREGLEALLVAAILAAPPALQVRMCGGCAHPSSIWCACGPSLRACLLSLCVITAPSLSSSSPNCRLPS